MGSDLKQRIIDSVKSTWKTINDLANYRRATGDDVSVSASDIDNIVSETVSSLDDTANSECQTIATVTTACLLKKKVKWAMPLRSIGRHLPDVGR